MCIRDRDYDGLDIELRYFRDVDRREVDFIITENNKPTLFLECKKRNRDINSALKYLKERFPETEAVQVALHGSDDYVNKHGIRITNAEKFLSTFI